MNNAEYEEGLTFLVKLAYVLRLDADMEVPLRVPNPPSYELHVE